MQESVKRVAILDELRGLVILLMVFYHGAYDVVVIFGVDWPFFFSAPMRWLQVFIAGSFIIVSGMCCRFSRSNLKRGAIAFGLGMAMTVVTAVAMPDQLILFGILHFLGVAMMLFALLRPLLDRIPMHWGAPLFGLLFFLTVYVPYGYIGFPPLRFALPSSLYNVGFLFPLGLPSPSFYSSNYFPLLPWLFLFLAASYLGAYARAGKMPAFCYRPHLPWLAAVGRHTIWIYILHQPILYAVLTLFFNVIVSFSHL